MRGRVTTRNGAPSSLSRAVVFISREHGSAGTLVKEPSPFPPPRLACVFPRSFSPARVLIFSDAPAIEQKPDASGGERGDDSRDVHQWGSAPPAPAERPIIGAYRARASEFDKTASTFEIAIDWAAIETAAGSRGMSHGYSNQPSCVHPIEALPLLA